jgi:hypothetical protein
VASEIRVAFEIRAHEFMNQIAGDAPDALVDKRVSNLANTYLRLLDRA